MKRHLTVIGYVVALLLIIVVGVYFNLTQSEINRCEKARLALMQELERHQAEYYVRAIHYNDIPAALAAMNSPNQDLAGVVNGVNKGNNWWAWSTPNNPGQGRACLRSVDGHYYWIQRRELSPREMQTGKPDADAQLIQ